MNLMERKIREIVKETICDTCYYNNDTHPSCKQECIPDLKYDCYSKFERISERIYREVVRKYYEPNNSNNFW